MIGISRYRAPAAILTAVWIAAAMILAGCGTTQDQRQTKVLQPMTVPSQPEHRPVNLPKKVKAVEVEGVISSVGQRTITFQVERKGKIREEVVGVDDKTNIEKGGDRVKLRDLQATDKAMINYEPEAYTPALAIRVAGKGEVKKVGGDD